MFRKTLISLLIVASYDASAIKLEQRSGRPKARDWNALARTELETGNYADCGPNTEQVLRVYYKKLLLAEFRFGEDSRQANETRYNNQVNAATAQKDAKLGQCYSTDRTDDGQGDQGQNNDDELPGDENNDDQGGDQNGDGNDGDDNNDDFIDDDGELEPEEPVDPCQGRDLSAIPAACVAAYPGLADQDMCVKLNELEEFNAKRLEMNNEYRSYHSGTDPLTFDLELACQVQQYVDTNMNENSDPTLEKPADQGENVHRRQLTRSIERDNPLNYITEVTWYDQWKNYNMEETSSPDYDSYTQMIWKASTTLACANAYVGDSENLVVCRYTPGGNIAGEYAQNIGEALL